MILTAFVALLYPLVVQYRRGGLYKALAPVAAFFVLLDVLANYTEWTFVFGLPAKGDWTLTHRLRRMESADALPARRAFAQLVNTFLHACEYDGHH